MTSPKLCVFPKYFKKPTAQDLKVFEQFERALKDKQLRAGFLTSLSTEPLKMTFAEDGFKVVRLCQLLLLTDSVLESERKAITRASSGRFIFVAPHIVLQMMEETPLFYKLNKKLKRAVDNEEI